MKAAMIVHFDHPFPGREIRALEYGVEVNEFWGKLAAEGKCTQPEMFFSTSGHGLWMVKGDLETLEQLVSTEKVQKLLEKGGLLMDGFGYEFHFTGDAADAYLLRYAGLVKELSLV